MNMDDADEPLKATVIGTGQIARWHLGCLARMPNARIVGVCDLSPALAESTAERFGVPAFFTRHEELLATTRPDVVHVTTPPQSHCRLALDALAAGAHVIVEKPLATHPAQVAQMLAAAAVAGRDLREDYNYLHNAQVLCLRRQLAAGTLGQVVHVEVFMCLDILGKDSRFADSNLRHPCLSLPGGAIYDFLTHFAYLAHAFIGAHRDVQCLWSKRAAASPLPADEFRALVHGEHATANIGFSAHGQPDVFWLRVYTTEARIAINLWEHRITIDRMRKLPRPLIPLLNGLSEARAIRRAAFRSLGRKLSGGPGAYEGLWTFLEETYAGWTNPQESSSANRIRALTQIREVNALLAALAATAPGNVSQPSPRPKAESGSGSGRRAI